MPQAPRAVAIDGANDSIYRVRDEDVGSRLRILVSATGANATGSANAPSPTTAPVIGPLPFSVARPTVAGPATVGSPLTGALGTWSGAPASFSYQWLQCTQEDGCVPNTGAIGSTYTPVTADVGFQVRVAVRAVDAAGGATVASSAPVTILKLPATTTTCQRRRRRRRGPCRRQRLAAVDDERHDDARTTTTSTTPNAHAEGEGGPQERHGATTRSSARGSPTSCAGSPATTCCAGSQATTRSTAAPATTRWTVAPGNDTLVGGAGNDRIVGGTGKDTIRCGAGKDTVIGARGDKVAKDCEKRR